MAGRPAGSRRQPVFGPLPASGENGRLDSRGRTGRCDRTGSGVQARRLSGAAAANSRATQVRVQEASNYQMIARRGRQCGVDAWTHRFRHHFSHTWLDRGGAEGDLMELNGWSSPQMLRRYGASARSARARRTYDRVMQDRP